MKSDRQSDRSEIRHLVRDGFARAADDLSVHAPQHIPRLSIRVPEGAGPDRIAAAFRRTVEQRTGGRGEE